MKKITAVLLATLLGMFMVVGSAGAFWVESIGVIPGSDWDPDISGVCYIEEDGCPESHGGQLYDTEAMYFKSYDTYAMLSIITGFPPEGIDYYSRHIYPGDIAFDFGAAGYDRGIKVSEDTGVGGSVGACYENTLWIPTTDFPSASPASIGSGDYLGFDVLSLVYGQYLATDHYVLEVEIPLEFFVGGPFRIHWTQTCGNDEINLVCNPIPEPASMMLFGTGLLGLVGFGKRKFFS